MRAPAFWWRKPGIRAGLLAPLARIYGAVAAARLARPGRDPGTPVLCVGNPTLGGAGKTPAAIAVAKLLIAAGAKPVFLSRGYGGQMRGPVRVDPATHGADDVGDEPLLLARIAPAIVAADRVAGAQAARAAGAGAIVMDDGFQNPALAKNLSILVVDGRRGIGNGRVFPAGPLRAPLGAQLARAHALVVVGAISDAAPVIAVAQARHLPVFRGRLVPDAAAIAALAQRKALAFAGIGDPDKFFATLTGAGVAVPVRRAFGDHHRYTAADAAALIAQAERQNLVPVTTAKDFVRLRGHPTLEALAARTQVLGVELVIDEADAFRRLVLGVVRNV